MDAKGVLRQGIEFSSMLAHAYVGDLTDAEWLVRSVPGTNHIAWQFGHLIAATGKMLNALGKPAPALPEGFAEAHNAATAGIDDPAKFADKATYLKLMDAMNAASLIAIDTTPDATLDEPGPESMREYAPTVCAALGILGTHWLMHLGQFIPIRRKLNKPPLF